MYSSKNSQYLGSVWLLSVLATLALLTLAACGGNASTSATAVKPTIVQSAPATSATSSSPSTNSVQIAILEKNGQYSFSPATVKVVKGTKIVWTNTTTTTHTVTPDTTAAFTGSSNLTHNQTYSLVMNTPGTYAYHCDIHPYMKATITVTSSSSMKPL